MNWREHWAQLDDAGHRHHTKQWTEFYARELMLYFPDRAANALEIGCGNGDLYEYLNRCFASYVGIDFSYAMIDKFKLKHPDAHLLCADATWLPMSGVLYDLVFSRQVAQYMDESMLRRNLEQVSHLLIADGIYILADIPDIRLRFYHYADALRGDHTPNWLGAIRRSVARRVRRREDSFGNWYSRQAVRVLAAECGFGCETFSSASYEYRFHAVLKKSDEHRRAD